MKEIKDLKLKNKSDLKKLDEKGLKKELTEAKKKMFGMKMKLKLSELKQTHLLKAIRKYIARIKTLSN